VRDFELVKQIVQAQSLDRRADADADRAVGVVRAHRDHRMVEAGIAHARHREEELAGKEGSIVHRARHKLRRGFRHA
jgi:hypothetical protein